MTRPSDRSQEGDRPAVESVADHLRRAISSHRAALAAAETVARRGGLPDLETVRVLEEPPTASARPTVGWAVTWWRKVLKHLALAWYVRPVLGQQNDFNRAASLRIAELVATVERLERRIAALEERSPPSGAP